MIVLVLVIRKLNLSPGCENVNIRKRSLDIYSPTPITKCQIIDRSLRINSPIRIWMLRLAMPNSNIINIRDTGTGRS